MKLYEYFRSSASYRVRIALNLKGLSYESIPIHLTRDGGEQRSETFAVVNPHALVPVLETDFARVSQSIAILEYLEETHPNVPLLPKKTADRAYVRQLALSIACDIHPLNNLRVLQYLRQVVSLDEDRVKEWVQHWIHTGFAAMEVLLARAPQRGDFSFGNSPTMADCCLIPQIFNAERFGVSLGAYPILRSIESRCLALEAFQRAHPTRQPDAE